MKVLANELVKIKHSKAVRGTFIAFLCLMAFAVLLGTSDEIDANGFAAPFIWILYNGASGFFLYGIIAAGMIASEFETGVIHNALSSGIGRGRYFAAKMVSLFLAVAAIYVLCFGMFTIAWSVKYGFDSNGNIFSDYFLKVVVYNAGMCLMLLSYAALFSFFAYLFRMAALTFVSAIAATISDLMGVFRGPMRIALDAIKYFHKDIILSSEFARLFLPCAVMLLVFIALSYVLFVLRDIE